MHYTGVCKITQFLKGIVNILIQLNIKNSDGGNIKSIK